MKNPQSLVGSLTYFDTKAYPFSKMFDACVMSFFKKKGLRIPKSTDRLHEMFDRALLSELYKWLFTMLNGSEFQMLYRRYIAKEIAPLFPFPIYFQRVPNPRIQMPHGKTVQYHTDEWYGHGAQVFNFWMPITQAFDTNTLRVLSLSDSIKWCRYFEKRSLPQNQMNKKLSSLAKPVVCGPGSIFTFNARVVHGTEVNQTSRTRMSMDFRILKQGNSSGDKSIAEYYTTVGESRTTGKPGQSGRPVMAAAYIYPRHGFTRFVTQRNQRLVVDEFAKKNLASIMVEETEIRTMPHHPTLLQLATGVSASKIAAVVLYSVLCMPTQRRDREKIYKTAKQHGVKLMFANENMIFPQHASMQDIERRYRELLRA